MDHGQVNPALTLAHQGITGLGSVYYNYDEPQIMAEALARGEGEEGQGGTFLVSTGKFTGRSPKDKHVVMSDTTRDTIWWDNNAEMSKAGFDALYEDMIAHMKGRDYFVQDLFAGADPTPAARCTHCHRIGVAFALYPPPAASSGGFRNRGFRTGFHHHQLPQLSG